MALPDLNNMTLDELQAIISAAQTEYHERYYERQSEVDEIRNGISTTIAELEALLGPETTEQGVDNIREIRNYSGAEMAQNASIALPLAFQGLEMLANTTLKLAKVLASQTDRPV